MDGRWVEVVWGVEVSNAADDTMVKLQDFGCRVEASNVEREIISEFCVLAPSTAYPHNLAPNIQNCNYSLPIFIF